MSPATRKQPTYEQTRSEALMSLGFTPTQALLLAATRDGGDHVRPADVERMLQAGCRHETALRILL